MSDIYILDSYRFVYNVSVIKKRSGAIRVIRERGG